MKKADTAYIIVGKVGSTYGLRGWLKIRTYTDFGANILNYTTWYLALGSDEWKTFDLEEGRIHGNGIIAKLAGINSPEEGRLLTGVTIAVKRSQLPPLKQNEYYWSDLIGLSVINKQGKKLGEVIYLMETGSNDVLVVKGDKEFAIPYLFGKVVLNVDLIKNEILVDWELL